MLAVNSRFTAQVFREAFARIAPKHPDPAVIYPAINLDSFVPPKFDDGGEEGAGAGKRKGKQQAAAFGGWVGGCDGQRRQCPFPLSFYFYPIHRPRITPSTLPHYPSTPPCTGPLVSLNRFERKKNIALALEAFALVRQRLLARGASASDRAAAQAMRLVVAGV